MTRFQYPKVHFDIYPQKTALIVVDMQNGFLKPGALLEIPRGRAMVPKLNKLISACREKGIRVIFLQQMHRQDGSDMGLMAEFIPGLAVKKSLIEGTLDAEIYDELKRQKGDIVVVKRTFSGFYGTDLELILRVNGIDTVIISGVATHTCCEATARDARLRNFKVIFLSDGTATFDQLPDMGWGTMSGDDVQKHVLTIMALRHAEVLSIDAVMGRISKS